VLIASNAKATAELGWRPSRSLEEMVADAWEFFTQQGQHPTAPAGG
jgi:UDP-glucose 4-epimerase